MPHASTQPKRHWFKLMPLQSSVQQWDSGGSAAGLARWGHLGLIYGGDDPLAVLLFDGTHPDACLVHFEQFAHQLAEVNAAVRHEVVGELAAVPARSTAWFN